MKSVLADTALKIKSMEIRGAGKIAREAASALKSHAESLDTQNSGNFLSEMRTAGDILLKTRPTAVSLPNAVNIILSGMDGSDDAGEIRAGIVRRADSFIERSNSAVRRIGEIGARRISDGDVVLTHCNSQVAIGCILEAHRQGKDIEVFATEVRPRNQGLLTIKSLSDAGIKTSFIVDSAARYFMKDVDIVVIGTDAVTVNGSVVNKIGTSQIALAAHEARTRVMVAAETYKFAPKTLTGELIQIEERDSSEVLSPEIAAAMPNVTVRNPAFDITPAEYIDLIVTEEGAIPPEMAYIIIKDYLGWKIRDFDNER
ncbi:ribose 1,5-bisphosphate isomerase [Methanoplanus limicola]|uniref:Ribose 1,5-bisphosphate isomerase n=1 Tax=Methanoplanus limicola DSM 2279 TaxID=937775 RepID=H1YWZ1_9EURY|nr:ribose 1,5-bisphosphate isomerase [Methanoplanus limicola]EHQ34914.1 ribose 1,5-bisphosphate isomerase [Methanoplanus limicola DSM 2279]